MINDNTNVWGQPRTFFIWFSLRYILHDLLLEHIAPYILNRYPYIRNIFVKYPYVFKFYIDKHKKMKNNAALHLKSFNESDFFDYLT